MAVLLAQLPACRLPPTTASAAVEPLAQAVVARLQLMHDVARWKWNTRRPVTDPEREQALLAELVPACTAAGLPEDFARAFFTAQFEAARLIQETDHKRWTAAAQGPFADVPDLPTVQRPRIDAASRKLIDALARAFPNLNPATRSRLQERARQLAVEREVPDAAVEAALRPLLGEKAAASH